MASVGIGMRAPLFNTGRSGRHSRRTPYMHVTTVPEIVLEHNGGGQLTTITGIYYTSGDRSMLPHKENGARAGSLLAARGARGLHLLEPLRGYGDWHPVC